MILKANLSTDVLTHVKDLKLGELAIILSGSMLNHVVLRCEIGLISLNDPTACVHKTILEQRALDITCRVLREDETIVLANKLIKPTQFTNQTSQKLTRKRKYNTIPENIEKDLAKDYYINKMRVLDLVTKYDVAVNTIYRITKKYRNLLQTEQEDDI